MKKIFCIGNIIILVVAAFGISKFYLSLSSDDIKETAAINDNNKPEKKVSVRVNKTGGLTIASISEAKPNNILHPKTKSDFVNDLKSALQENNELAAQIALESASGCESCITQLIKIITDSSYDKTFRKYTAKALIKSGNEQGVLTVLSTIIDAHKQEDNDFKEQLMQILATADSVDTADTLAKVLTGKASFSPDLLEIPEDVTYAIKKALRLCPNEAVGEKLAQNYFNAVSEEDKKQLADIKQPVMIVRMAENAYEKGEIETADRLMEQLAGVQDQSAIKGIMLLAKEQSVPLDNVANMMSFWQMTRSGNDQTHDVFVEYLSNSAFTSEERAVAANAIGHEKDKDMAISALQKAHKYEHDPLVQGYIGDALSRIYKN